MRKFTTEHTVYEFDELSKDAQDKAIQDWRDREDFPWLSDDMNNELEYLLEQAKISYEFTPNLYYSLSYSQGDGAMFEGTVKWRGYTVTIKQSGHYYHENSKSIDIETRAGNDAKESVYEQFNEVYVDICRKLERYGYDQMEHALSEENVAQWIRENEYEFYADGSMA